MVGYSKNVSFIRPVTDLLRGDYKASDYGKVVLPFTVLRRLNCDNGTRGQDRDLDRMRWLREPSAGLRLQKALG